MQPRTINLLEDILTAGAVIQKLTSNRRESDYLADVGMQYALAQTEPAVADRISNSRLIVDFRNVIAHGYDTVDDLRVWKVVVNRLPLLMSEVEALLKEQGSPDPMRSH